MMVEMDFPLAALQLGIRFCISFQDVNVNRFQEYMAKSVSPSIQTGAELAFEKQWCTGLIC